jgi:hypothetical protein
LLNEQPKETIQFLPYKGKIKQGQTEVPAEVVSNDKPIKVKVFIEEYDKNNIVPLVGYSNTLEIGSKIIVTVNQINKKGVILDVKFKKIYTAQT